MKKLSLKKILVALFSFALLITVSSCSGSKYYDGKLCGDAREEGTTYFNIRKYYIEQYVYEKEKPTEADLSGEDALKYSIYENLYYLDEDSLINISDTNDDRYYTSHYLFAYYSSNQSLCDAIIDDSITDVNSATAYKDLVSAQSNLYISKINNADTTDSETASDREGNEISSIETRLKAHSASQGACITFEDNFVDPTTHVTYAKTTWKQAFDVGVLNGLFVYPMSLLINVFVKWFGYDNGWGQVFAIFFVTIVLKLAIFLLTMKSQASTQKMQDMQPELTALQAKYGTNPTQEQKQRMSMEMMALYQKYGVKPLAPFVSLLITFPVFISMYRAVSYLAVLRTGKLGQIVMGNNLNTYIIGGNFRYEALIIFLIMAASQILTMKLPQILNKKRMSQEAKQQQGQANMMTNVMMIMILFMGFMMPVTMSIYWIASALVSIAQSLLMHKLNNSSKNGRFKLKKQETKTYIPQGKKVDK